MNDYKTTLKLTIKPVDKNKIYQVFELKGDMDKEGLTIVKSELEKMAQNFQYKYFVFDFSKLEYINSESIGFLMALHSHLVKEKKMLVLVSANPHVKDILSVIGIFSVLEYYDSLEEFIRKIASP